MIDRGAPATKTSRPARRGGDERPAGRLPVWARASDAAAVALLLLAAFVALEGGFVAHPGGLRVSIRSEWRVLAWAGVLLALRHLLVRRPAIHEPILKAARAPGPLPDDLELLGRERSAPQAERHPGWRRSVAGLLGLMLLYAALTAFMTYPQVRQMDRVSEDMGDPLLSTWRLSWIAHQLPRDPLHLFDANIFHPERRTLAYSDSMLVPSLSVAPLVWLGVHQVLAYNLLLLSGFAFSGVSMFLLVRALTGQVAAAVFAGFVFAFLPYRFMHYNHLELQMAQWMPLCLWAFHRTVNGGRVGDGLLTGVFFALQTLSSLYYGIFFATCMVPVAIALFVGAGRERVIGALRPLAAGGLLAAILVTPIVVPYLQARRTVGERPLSEIEFYSATPQNYFAAPVGNLLYRSHTARWGGQERDLFQGVTVCLLALVALWPPLSAARMGYALGLLLAFELSLGLNGALYPWLHAYALPYRGLRVPARLGIIVGLMLAILAGYAVARITHALRGRWRKATGFVVLLLLVFLEYRNSVHLRHVWPRPPAVYERFLNQPATVFLELPLVAPDISIEPIFMYFSTFHWHKLVNGYSGFSPYSYHRLLDLMARFPDDASMSELQRRDVEFLIVHGALYDHETYEALIPQLDARQDLVLVGISHWQSRETRLYRLRRPA